MKRALRLRLYPSKQQRMLLEEHLETSRRFYNACLEQRQMYWRTAKEQVSAYNQIRELTSMRAEDEFLGRAPCMPLQQVPIRLEKAMKAFFEGRSKFPRFKGRATWRSLVYPRAKLDFSFEYGRIRLLKVGWMKARGSLPGWLQGASPKQAVVKQTAGKWFVSIVFEIPEGIQRDPAPRGSKVGLDLGIGQFIATSDGMRVSHPKWAEGEMMKLKRLQRWASRKRRGSKNRVKANRRVGRCHERIRNNRDEFLHHLSRMLVSRYETIVVEDLNFQGLSRSALAGRIQASAWGRFVWMLEYKAAEHGGKVVRVNPAYTSQDCSVCGRRVPKDLSVRTHECPCGYSEDRDVNAAKNILVKAESQVDLPQQMGEVTPVEKGSYSNESHASHHALVQCPSQKQERVPIAIQRIGG